MNWLINVLQKEARRFRPNDEVRFFTHPSRGTGKGVVYTPSFRRGRIRDYDSESKRYRVFDEKTQEEHSVHPRNLVPNSVSPNGNRSSDLPVANDLLSVEAPSNSTHDPIA